MPYKDQLSKKWKGCVWVKDKRKIKSFDTKREATAWEISTKKDLLKPKPLLGLTFLHLSTKYLDYCTRFSKQVVTEKETLCKKLLKAWGPDKEVADISPAMILSYLTAQAKKRSAHASNKDRKNMLAMWNFGIKFLNVQANPILKIQKLPHDTKPQYTPPTEDILKVLMASTKEEKVFLTSYLQTGARRSEIFHWQWSQDINFAKREVRLGTRKTKDGSMDYTWLPMSDELYTELYWWWQHRPSDTYVFVVMDKANAFYGKPFTHRRKFMHGLCKRAGVKEFGFHALRRYVASVLADTHKISAKTIQIILRHKSIVTTEKYIHNINRDLKGVMNLLTTENSQEDTPIEKMG